MTVSCNTKIKFLLNFSGNQVFLCSIYRFCLFNWIYSDPYDLEGVNLELHCYSYGMLS